GRDPHARQRTAEAGVLQRLARGVAVFAVTNQQQLEPSGPVGGRRAVDVFCSDIKSLPPTLHQAIEAVAADLAALEPAVGGQPGHRGSHHAGVDIELFEELQQRAEPDRTATRHDRIAEHGDDDRAGARRFALQLLDDTGKRWRHASRHSAFFGFTTTLAPTSPSPRSCGERVGVRGSRREFDRREYAETPLTRRYAPTSPRKSGARLEARALPMRVRIHQATPAASVERRPLALCL